MPIIDTEDLMNAGEVAKLAGIGRSTLSTYVLRGHGPIVTPIAGHTLFLREDVDKWLANRPGRGARTDLA
jgi:predicted DNA-binding transcriptional regulator AlpA